MPAVPSLRLSLAAACRPPPHRIRRRCGCLPGPASREGGSCRQLSGMNLNCRTLGKTVTLEWLLSVNWRILQVNRSACYSPGQFTLETARPDSSYTRGSPGEARRATCRLVCFRAACPQPCGDKVIFTGGKVAHLGSLTVDGSRGSVPVIPCPGRQDPTGGAGDSGSGPVCRPRVSSEFCGLHVQSSGRPPEPRVGGRGVAGRVPGGRSLLKSESTLGAEPHDAQPQQAPRRCRD